VVGLTLFITKKKKKDQIQKKHSHFVIIFLSSCISWFNSPIFYMSVSTLADLVGICVGFCCCEKSIGAPVVIYLFICTILFEI
jgi:hypothetical protein